MSINLNYVLRENGLKLTWSKERIGCVWSFILLEVIKIYFSVLKYFLAYLGSSVKTSIVLTVLTLDHQEFKVTGTLDFVPAMFFLC